MPITYIYTPSATLWQILGEYLHFCYFAFYFILAGTWPLAWVFCAREHFDAVTSSITVAYLLCLSTYLIIPVKGPFWTYQRPLPGDVGWLFSYLTHAIDEGGSSPGRWERKGCVDRQARERMGKACVCCVLRQHCVGKPLASAG